MLLKFARKWYPLLIIIGILAFWLVVNTLFYAPPRKSVVVAFDSYSILKGRDQYYLRIHEEANILPRSMSAVPLLSIVGTPSPEFRSIQEMQDSILGGKLTKENLYHIWQNFPYDSDRDFYILDPYNIPAPQIPSGMQLSWVVWGKSSCHFSFRSTSDLWISMDCCEQTKEHNVHTKFDQNLKKLKEYIYQTEQIQDRNATVYYHYDTIIENRKEKTILYDLSTEGKQLVIYERYNNVNDTVPAFTDFCGIENGVYFTGRIEDADSPLSVEFLQSIGIFP